MHWSYISRDTKARTIYVKLHHKILEPQHKPASGLVVGRVDSAQQGPETMKSSTVESVEHQMSSRFCSRQPPNSSHPIGIISFIVVSAHGYLKSWLLVRLGSCQHNRRTLHSNSVVYRRRHGSIRICHSGAAHRVDCGDKSDNTPALLVDPQGWFSPYLSTQVWKPHTLLSCLTTLGPKVVSCL